MQKQSLKMMLLWCYCVCQDFEVLVIHLSAQMYPRQAAIKGVYNMYSVQYRMNDR